MVLIKKKDVNSYFADRKGRHPLRAQRVSTAPTSAKVSPVGAIDVPGSSALTVDPRVPPVTSERGFIDAPPPIVKRWAKS